MRFEGGNSQIKVAIINTNAGNIHSLIGCMTRLKVVSEFVMNPEDLDDSFTHIIIPGQGRFGRVMNFFRDSDWIETLERWKKSNKTIIGICVGMQVFYETSEEDDDIKGFAWLKGKVHKLNSPKQPMMGWAKVQLDSDDFPTGFAYFVNSYVLGEVDSTIGKTDYGESFASFIKSGNLLGMQFHPEKSGKYGEEILKLCLAY